MLWIDRETARLLADWYPLGAHALAAFATAMLDDETVPAQLWPEHFDLAIVAVRVNYDVRRGSDVATASPARFAIVTLLPKVRAIGWNDSGMCQWLGSCIRIDMRSRYRLSSDETLLVK